MPINLSFYAFCSENKDENQTFLTVFRQTDKQFIRPGHPYLNVWRLDTTHMASIFFWSWRVRLLSFLRVPCAW